jgi:hypothetical protein
MDASTLAMLSARKGDKLRDSAQWNKWIDLCEQFATTRRVWQFCNPATPESNLPMKMEEPIVEPYPEDYRDEKRVKLWRDQFDLCKFHTAQWEKQERGIAEVQEWILAHLDEKFHSTVQQMRSPHQRLQTLKTRFGTSTAYEEEVIRRWHAMAAARPPKDVLSWIDDWDALREEAVDVGVVMTHKDAARHFFQAVKEVLPMWWQVEYRRCFLQHDVFTIQEIMDSFRVTYRELGPLRLSSNAPKSAFSTWQGYEEAKPGETNTGSKPVNKAEGQPQLITGPMDKRHCPCGRQYPRHRPAICWYVNPKLAPETFNPYGKKVQKVKKLLDNDPEWRTYLDKLVAQENSQGNAQKKVASLNYDVKEVHEQMGAPALNFSTVMHARASRGEPMGKTTTPKRSLPPNVKHRPEMHNRWILVSGANIHVCNDKSRFISFTPDEASLSTGDASSMSYGTGTVRLTGRNPETGVARVITLSDVEYAPGFHTSIVSYHQLKIRGVNWCQQTDCLLEKTTGKPIVSTTHDPIGLWIFDRPNEEGKSLY